MRDASVKVLASLPQAILKASYDWASSLAGLLTKQGNSTDSQLAALAVHCEFLCFFMHLANRTAHSELSAEKAEALQGFLLDTMRRAWVDGYFRDWPETRKVGIANDFLRKLNDAELEYSRCKGLVSREHMFTANTLMQAFARNVTELLGHENMNPEVFMTVMEHTVSAFTSMHLEEKVRGAGAAL